MSKELCHCDVISVIDVILSESNKVFRERLRLMNSVNLKKKDSHLKRKLSQWNSSFVKKFEIKLPET